MQMSETRRSIDVFRVSGFGGDTPVERLADLADDNQIVNRPGSERPEQVAPGLRYGGGRTAKGVYKLSPWHALCLLIDVSLSHQACTENINLRPEWAWGSRCSIITAPKNGKSRY